VRLSAEDQHAVHRRDLVHRRPHAARRGQFFGTLIHHARVGGCTFAQAQVAIPIAVILTAQRRCLMARAGLLLLGRAGRRATRVVAIALASEARPAEREQAAAESASLEAQQPLVVHRSLTAKATNLPRLPAASIVGSSRRPSAEGLGLQSGALDLFGVLARRI
jgi:hypothetical protein